MRTTAVVSAVFAATVLAGPVKHSRFHGKRDIVVVDEYDTVVVTEVDYVYAEATPAAAAPAADPDVVVVTVVAGDPAPTPAPDAGYAAPAPAPASADPAGKAADSAPATNGQFTDAGSQTVGIPQGIIYDLAAGSDLFGSIVANSHNIHRQNHTNTPDIAYAKYLESAAYNKAQTCDNSEDTLGPNYGMNWGYGTFVGPANVSATIEDMWYNSEISLFPGFGIASPDMSNFLDWGHFSQVVWPTTTHVGCWSTVCGAGSVVGDTQFTVCMYDPPGNYGGQFNSIGQPYGHDTHHGN